jgi:hypothetical protein
VATLLIGLLLAGGAVAQEGLVEGLPAAALAQALPLFGWSQQGRNPAIVFARLGASERPRAGILISTRDGWRLAAVPDEVYYAKWIYVGRSANGEQIWGIGEMGDGERAPDLGIAMSANGGRAWSFRSTLHKVSPYAVLEAVGMDQDGRGAVVLRLDEDPGANAPRLGFYQYLTQNGGKSWSEPIYSFERPPLSGSMPAAPDKTYSYDAPPSADAWRGILSSLTPQQ